MKKDLSKRVHIIDEVRGFAIICMVVYHGFYDYCEIFGNRIPLFYSDWLQILKMGFVGLFVFISGAACKYSRNNLKRGIICFAIAMAMTVSTWSIQFIPQKDVSVMVIKFGIIHLLGASMIIFALVSKHTDKIPAKHGLWIFSLLFIITYGITDRYIGIFPILKIDLPDWFYITDYLFAF